MQTAALKEQLQELLDEQVEVVHERRSVERKPFVRPAKILTGRDRDQSHDGCTKDITARGIGILMRAEMKPSSRATLIIHGVKSVDVAVEAEVRWCEPFGKGWYLTGWRFVD